MTTAGLVVMALSLGFVVTLNVYCFARVLGRRPRPGAAPAASGSPSRDAGRPE